MEYDAHKWLQLSPLMAAELFYGHCVCSLEWCPLYAMHDVNPHSGHAMARYMCLPCTYRQSTSKRLCSYPSDLSTKAHMDVFGPSHAAAGEHTHRCKYRCKYRCKHVAVVCLDMPVMKNDRWYAKARNGLIYRTVQDNPERS